MISEPELVSEDGYGQAELPGEHRESAGADRETMDAERPVRRRPPWAWALAGAVGASALWAGGLYAYERVGPDLGGYRATENLCEDAELKALTGALGVKQAPTPWVSEHAALDQAKCMLSLEPLGQEPLVDEEGNEISADPYAEIGYDLHRRVDPEAEFEATLHTRAEMYYGESRTVKPVDGLGERAFLIISTDNSRSLEVLDGQARLSLSVTPGYYGEDEERTDLSKIEPLLVEDMKALMARLKSPA
ncbi:hypothetical protein [Streptomyces sp. MUM 178J]|uniref:hypothetical protein n=1 Tax=Streptomyces sp. MUM 178J TaxID=2791991 RepID=UPI001F03880A|nr:hypothetical protein [Streptomyces sp. MUM 178J]WRQ81582.1 hypothetical protein I3F59_020735 [Streptomyces sp. MUM 178J]